MDAALQRLAATDPTRTLAALQQLEPRDWAHWIQLGWTLGALGKSGGAATMDWLSTPEAAATAIPTQVHRTVFQSWMKEHPAAATAWLAAQPEETRPQECVQAAVSRLTGGGPSDLEAARQWASTLRNANERDSALVDVFVRWSGIDTDAALKALEQSPLPEAKRQSLHDEIVKRKGGRQ